MKRRSSRLFWLIYLIYFVSYAVVPVSGILPDERDQDFADGQNIIDCQDNHAGIFLLDLALWSIIKNAKSEALKISTSSFASPRGGEVGIDSHRGGGKGRFGYLKIG